MQYFCINYIPVKRTQRNFYWMCQIAEVQASLICGASYLGTSGRWLPQCKRPRLVQVPPMGHRLPLPPCPGPLTLPPFHPPQKREGLHHCFHRLLFFFKGQHIYFDFEQREKTKQFNKTAATIMAYSVSRTDLTKAKAQMQEKEATSSQSMPPPSAARMNSLNPYSDLESQINQAGAAGSPLNFDHQRLPIISEH